MEKQPLPQNPTPILSIVGQNIAEIIKHQSFQPDETMGLEEYISLVMNLLSRTFDLSDFTEKDIKSMIKLELIAKIGLQYQDIQNSAIDAGANPMENDEPEGLAKTPSSAALTDVLQDLQNRLGFNFPSIDCLSQQAKTPPLIEENIPIVSLTTTEKHKLHFIYYQNICRQWNVSTKYQNEMVDYKQIVLPIVSPERLILVRLIFDLIDRCVTDPLSAIQIHAYVQLYYLCCVINEDVFVQFCYSFELPEGGSYYTSVLLQLRTVAIETYKTLGKVVMNNTSLAINFEKTCKRNVSKWSIHPFIPFILPPIKTTKTSDRTLLDFFSWLLPEQMPDIKPKS